MTDDTAQTAQTPNGGRHQEPTHRIEQAIAKHYDECRLSHPTNGDWFACEARAIADAPPR